MEIQVERNDSCEALVTVGVDTQAVEEAKRKAARSLSEKSNLPGFRKGKAPYHVVLQAFGEDALLDEALDTLGPSIYREMLDAEKLEPSAVGRMEAIVSKDPLTLKFVVPLKPEIELGSYREVRLPYEAPTVPEEDVERTMEDLRLSQSILEPVDRAAQFGDVLVADMSTHVAQEGKEKEALTFEGDENPLELDLDENLGGRYPGAGAALVGIAEGDSRETEFVYPDSFPVARLRGLKVQLEVKCLGVKIRKTPDWTDELAKTIADKESVEELRKDVRERIENQMRDEKKHAFAESILEKMVEGASIKFPTALLEEELEEEIMDIGRRLEERKTSLEVYLRTIPDGLAGLKKRLEPEIRQKLIRNLFLANFIKQEKIEAPEADVEKEFETYLRESESSSGKKPKRSEKNDELLRKIIANNIVAQRVSDRIAEIGQGTAPTLESA